MNKAQEFAKLADRAAKVIPALVKQKLNEIYIPNLIEHIKRSHILLGQKSFRVYLNQNYDESKSTFFDVLFPLRTSINIPCEYGFDILNNQNIKINILNPQYRSYIRDELENMGFIVKLGFDLDEDGREDITKLYMDISCE